MARRKAPAKRGPSYARRLVIMAKRPAMGRVKRRLAREIGATAAVRFYRFSLTHTVLRLAADPRWLTVIALDSIAGGAKFRSRKRAALMPQGAGNLGARMQRLIEDLVDFNRVRLGIGIAVEMTEVSLAQLCERELEQIRAAYPAADVRLRVTGDCSGHWDSERLQQVL